MDLLNYLALIPALGFLAQWIALRTRLPGILLLLGFGILLGFWVRPDRLLAELTGGDEAAGPQILFPLVSLSVAVILFEGGLTLRLSELRQAGSSVFRLVTVGAGLTLISSTLAAHFILDFGVRLSLLLGAILVVTGPTVISPMLRQIRPSRRVASVLKWEGIVIDPVGAVLAILVFEEVLVAAEQIHLTGVIWLLVKTVGIGIVIGGVMALVMIEALRRYWIADHLHGIAGLAAALTAFAASNVLAEESGLVTVTWMGLILANQERANIEHLIEFKENLRVLLIGCLFILLGSRLDVGEVIAVGWPGVAFLGLSILVIRPLSVAAATVGTRLNWRERVFTAAVAPRGIVAAAVASVFALKLEAMAAEQGVVLIEASRLVSVTFFMILGTVTVYGLAASLVARLLRLATPNPQGVLIVGAEPWVREIAMALARLKLRVVLVDTNYNKAAAARMEGLEAHCVSVLSDHGMEDVDLGGIGRLLAMTANDEVNTLATREFRNVFGRAGVYQLAPKGRSTTGRRSMSARLRGRVLFGTEMTHGRITELVAAGSAVKTTSLTETFGYEDFFERYGRQSVVLFVIDEDGYLRINTTDQPLSPKAGQTLVALVTSVPVPKQHPVQQESQSHAP